MATRKKLQQAEPLREGGLLHGPSRKQWDWETPRTGEFERKEVHRVLAITSSLVAPSTGILLTVPANKQARILYFMLTKDATNVSNLKFTDTNGSIVTLLYLEGTAVTQAQSFTYEDAMIVGENGTITHFTTSTGSVATISYVIEDYDSGYITPTGI